MDYTKVPRALIYKDRKELDDFPVIERFDPPQMEAQFLYALENRPFINEAENASELILKIFNNARYITTLIHMENHPRHYFQKYLNKARENETSIIMCNHVMPATMALVRNYLCNYFSYYNGSKIVEDITNNFNTNAWKEHTIGGQDDFNKLLIGYTLDNKIVDPSFVHPLWISDKDFNPRDIIDAIENVKVDDLAIGVIYVCNKLALLNDSNLRLYGVNLAIARLNDDLQKIYEDWGYDPETKKFVPEMNDPLGVAPDEYELFDKITLLKKKAVDYIIEHYPAMEENDSKEKDAESPQVSEAEVLQSKKRELESKLTLQVKEQMEANKINSQQATRIKEIEAEVIPIKDLEADLEELRKWNQLSREQVALFCHALAEYCEFAKKTKKKDIAPMAHGLFGIGIKSAYNLMVSGYSKKDREHVAKIFETIWPPFANFILNTFDKKEQQLKQ